MAEEQDFWINKDEVSALSNAEGTLYKVTRKTMNRKGWHKLNSNEQVVKKVELTKEEADWFEKHKGLPFYECTGSNDFISKLFDKLRRYYQGWEKRDDFFKRQTQAYFNGYTIEKEKYYIKLNFNRVSACLNIDEITDSWFFETRTEYSFYKNQFTQTEIDEMQEDPQARGLDLNELKVEVPEDELED